MQAEQGEAERLATFFEKRMCSGHGESSEVTAVTESWDVQRKPCACLVPCATEPGEGWRDRRSTQELREHDRSIRMGFSASGSEQMSAPQSLCGSERPAGTRREALYPSSLSKYALSWKTLDPRNLLFPQLLRDY